MGESTQYGVLAIVAIVAIVAIITMGQSVIPQSAVVEQPRANVAGQAITIPAYSQMDYNSDGRISRVDAQLLADAIALNQCPANKTCDLDSNNMLDERDLEVLNSLFSEPVSVASQKSQTSPASGNVVASSSRQTSSVGSRLA